LFETIKGARGGEVGCGTALQLAGSIPDGVVGNFYCLSQYSSWIDPYVLFRYIMLFTLHELYKSEGLHNVPIIHVL
jgi:hypothetical protein